VRSAARAPSQRWHGVPCDPTPWEVRSKHFTQEFEAFALTLMREMPVKHP